MKGREKMATADVEFRLTTAKAAIAVSSLDGRPIAASQRMLISMVAQVVASADERLPLLSEPVEGELRVRSASDLVLQPLRVDATAPVVGRREGEWLVFVLPSEAGTHWMELRAR